MKNELPEKKTVPKYFQRKYPWIPSLLLVLMLIALAGWQYVNAQQAQSDSKNKTDTISKLETDLKSKQLRISGLESQAGESNEKIAVLEATIKGFKQGTNAVHEIPSYKLVINSVRADPIFVTGMEDENKKRLYVNVSVTNASKTDGYVAPLDFTLKNSVDEKMPIYKEDSYYNSYYDKEHSAELLGQSIVAGDSAKGTLLFIVGKNDQAFTLHFNGETISISASL